MADPNKLRPWACTVSGGRYTGSVHMISPACLTSDFWRSKGHEDCGYHTPPLGKLWNPYPSRSR